MVLAAWYKRALKESLLSKIYADKAKVKGVDQDPQTNEQIYRQYLKAYKKGVFNFIKEDLDKYTNETIPRKYFSGGVGVDAEVLTRAIHRRTDPEAEAKTAQVIGDGSRFDNLSTVEEESEASAQEAQAASQAMMADVGAWKLATKVSVETAAPLSQVVGGLALQNPENFKSLQEKIAGIMAIVKYQAGAHIPLVEVQEVDKEYLRHRVPGRDDTTGWEEYHRIMGESPYTLQYANILLKVNGLENAQEIAYIILTGAQAAQKDIKNADAFVQYIRDFNAAVNTPAASQAMTTQEIAPDTNGEVFFGPNTKSVTITQEGSGFSIVITRFADGTYLASYGFGGKYVKALIDGESFTPPNSKVIIERHNGDNFTIYNGQKTQNTIVKIDRAMGASEDVKMAFQKLAGEAVEQANRTKTKVAIEPGVIQAEVERVRNRENHRIGVLLSRIQSEVYNRLGTIQDDSTKLRWVNGRIRDVDNIINNLKRLEIQDESTQLELDAYSRISETLKQLQKQFKKPGQQKAPASPVMTTPPIRINQNGKLRIKIEDRVVQIKRGGGRKGSIITVHRQEDGIYASYEPGGKNSVRLEDMALPGNFEVAISLKGGDLMVENTGKTPITVTTDEAMMTRMRITERVVTGGRKDQTMVEPGGIDMNAANLNLQIKRDGQGVPLPISQQNLENIHIDGLIPVILDIRPATSTGILAELMAPGTAGISSG